MHAAEGYKNLAVDCRRRRRWTAHIKSPPTTHMHAADACFRGSSMVMAMTREWSSGELVAMHGPHAYIGEAVEEQAHACDVERCLLSGVGHAVECS